MRAEDLLYNMALAVMTKEAEFEPLPEYAQSRSGFVPGVGGTISHAMNHPINSARQLMSNAAQAPGQAVNWMRDQLPSFSTPSMPSTQPAETGFNNLWNQKIVNPLNQTLQPPAQPGGTGAGGGGGVAQ